MKRPTNKQIRYAMYLLRKEGKYSEQEMTSVVVNATFESMKQLIDDLKDGKGLTNVNTQRATRQQLGYANRLMQRLGYDEKDYLYQEQHNMSRYEMGLYLKELEYELEEREIMADVYSYGQV